MRRLSRPCFFLITVINVLPFAGTGGLRGQAKDPVPGLLGEYFVARGIRGDRIPKTEKPFFVRVDPQVAFEPIDGEFYGSKLGDNLLVRWSGWIRIPKAGKFTFATESDDGSRLYIDGRRVVENWGPHGMARKAGTVELTAGDHEIRVTFQEIGGGAGCIASWAPPGEKEHVIPKGALFHSRTAEAASMAAWDREKWRKFKKPAPRRASGRSFDANMGPVIATAVDLGRDERGTNTVYRGIIVRLDAEGKSCVVFDADTMRMAAAFTDGSLVLAGLPFTAAHGKVPSVRGETVFSLGARPGWAKGSEIADPRPGDYPPLGRLPSDWAHYKGLYMSGDRVVLHYTVGDSKVWETSALASRGDQQTIVRTLKIERSGEPMALVLSDAPSEASELCKIEDGVAIIAGDSSKTATMIRAASSGGGKLATKDGALLFELPAGRGASSIRVAYTRRSRSSADEFRKESMPNLDVDVMAWTKGGEKRWPNVIKTKGAMAPARLSSKNAYVVDRVTVPYDNEYEPRMRIGGLDFFSDGTTAAVSTWDGDVWIVKGIDDNLENLEWKRFATGLHEPLGLTIVDDVIYTVDDMQITRFHDLDKNGEADYYENFNNDWQLTSGFHAFCFDLQTDGAGNFYFSFGSPVRSGGRSFERMGEHHGSILRVSKDGSKLVRYASGLRAPNGIGVSKSGQVTSGDNEGTFMPRCPINWISEGEFCGVVDSANSALRQKMTTTATRRDRIPAGREKSLDTREMPKPLVWLPKNVDNSGGGQVWVDSEKWGPLTGSLLHMSYGTSSLFLVLKEQKGEIVQGGVVKFPLKFTSSAMRGRFNPRDGQLYVAGLRGWQTNAVREGGLDRVRYTGKPLSMPVGLRTNKTGLELSFSAKLDPELARDPDSFEIRAADILWTQAYGSKEYKIGQRGAARPQSGWSDLEVTTAHLKEDGKTVVLEIKNMPLAHEMEISIDVETTDGRKIRTKIWNTVHRLD